MLRWAAGAGRPARVVDPGAGSGRFLLAAGRAFPEVALVAVETDPLAGLTLRANAAVLGMADRLTLLAADYRTVDLPDVDGPTLYVGNPPYVRHHDIAPAWKDWLAAAAAQYGLRASRLAGLHVHFVLKTCPARPAGRLRRVHHRGRMARRELRRRHAPGVRRRARRRGAARGESRGGAVPRRRHDRGDRLFPHRAPVRDRPGARGRRGRGARRPGRGAPGRPVPARRRAPLVPAAAPGRTRAARLRRTGRAVPGPPGTGDGLQRRLDRRPLSGPAAGRRAGRLDHPGPGTVRRRAAPLLHRRPAPGDRPAGRSRGAGRRGAAAGPALPCAGPGACAPTPRTSQKTAAPGGR